MTTVYGYIRFSFFGRNDTRISRSVTDDDKRFEILYNPERMEERFYFFERITLPSLRTQIDQDFKILIVSSEIMPDEYKLRLNALVSDVPQIEVIYSSAAHVTDELNPRIADMTAGIREKTVHFRLDDDDAICTHMIGLLRATAPLGRRGELISFPRGLFLTMEDDVPRLVRKFEPYIAIAWAYVNRPGLIRNPYQGIHTLAHHTLPSMLNPRPLAYIHVSHDSSDTKHRKIDKLERARSYDPKFEVERDKIDAELQANFPGFTASSLEDIIMNAPGRKS